jgi:hypothetical protein
VKQTDLAVKLRETNELLERLLIVQLVLARVPRQNIRRIVGCEMNKVTRIARAVRVIGE